MSRPSRSPHVSWQASALTRDRRWRASAQRGATVWFTGLPASGKSTLAASVGERLLVDGRLPYLLDADNLRHGLNGDLGFSEADRAENVRRAAHVACLFADAGLVALTSIISPYAAGRASARAIHDEAGLPFVEVFVNTPLEECERRDPKGLYARARAGNIAGFTGVGAPYEPPEEPDLELAPHTPLEEAVEAVLSLVPPSGV